MMQSPKAAAAWRPPSGLGMWSLVDRWIPYRPRSAPQARVLGSENRRNPEICVSGGHVIATFQVFAVVN